MQSKFLVLIALLVAVVLGTAGTALADNNASGSIGTVQAGNTAVNPSASAGLPATGAAASAPTSVAGSGNNNSSNSIGTAQIGGGNTTGDELESIGVCERRRQLRSRQRSDERRR